MANSPSRVLAILSYIAARPHLYDYLYASKPLTDNDECKVEVELRPKVGDGMKG